MKVENRFSKTAIILLICLGMLFMCAAPTFAETDASDETSNGAETTETTEATETTETTETIAPQTYIEGWRKDNIGWWYRNADGTYPASQWKAIKGYWYYFDQAGYMVQGWQHIGSKWYYFDESGAMVQGWQHIGSKWYYFDESGYMTQGWQYLDGVWYYLGWPNDPDSGAMATGLREIDGRKYYFNPSGAMQRGHQSIDGTLYYFGFPEHPDTGAMRFGWIDDKESGCKYYAGEDGKLVTGLFQMDEAKLKAFLDATKEANLVEVSEESTEDLMQAYVPEDIEIYFDETGKFKQASEFEIDGEFYGADDNGKVFKYSNSELISGKIQARSYGSRKGRPVTKITIHHMAGIMSGEHCGRYFEHASEVVSSTYGIGYEGDIYQYVDEKDWSFCSANPDNDKSAITIEVSNIKRGDDWPISDESMDALLDLCTDICQRNGIEYLDFTGDASGNLTMHKWFMATNCPGPYLESRFPTIAEEVNLRLHHDETETLGWVKIAGKWYYYDESGAVRGRWIQDNGNWYYLKSSGAMASEEYINGWWLNKNGSWTYPYQARWYQNASGRWWYGDESGWYASGARYRIDGVDYRFNNHGLWVGWEY